LAKEAQKRETGSIESGGDLRVDLGSQIIIGDFRESRVFHLNSRVSYFTLMSSLCKLGRIGIRVTVIRGMCVLEPHRFQDVSQRRTLLLAYVVIPASLVSLARYGAGLISASGFEHPLVPSRLAFLQRSASGTVGLRLS